VGVGRSTAFDFPHRVVSARLAQPSGTSGLTEASATGWRTDCQSMLARTSPGMSGSPRNMSRTALRAKDGFSADTAMSAALEPGARARSGQGGLTQKACQTHSR